MIANKKTALHGAHGMRRHPAASLSRPPHAHAPCTCIKHQLHAPPCLKPRRPGKVSKRPTKCYGISLLAATKQATHQGPRASPPVAGSLQALPQSKRKLWWGCAVHPQRTVHPWASACGSAGRWPRRGPAAICEAWHGRPGTGDAPVAVRGLLCTAACPGAGSKRHGRQAQGTRLQLAASGMAGRSKVHAWGV